MSPRGPDEVGSRIAWDGYEESACGGMDVPNDGAAIGPVLAAAGGAVSLSCMRCGNEHQGR